MVDGTRKHSDRRRRYSRSLSRERIYRRGGTSDNSDGYDDRDRYRRRDRDRYNYNYRGRGSSESSQDSYK